MKSDPDLILPTTAEAQCLDIDEITLAEYEIMLEDRYQQAPASAGSGSPAFQGVCR